VYSVGGTPSMRRLSDTIAQTGGHGGFSPLAAWRRAARLAALRTRRRAVARLVPGRGRRRRGALFDKPAPTPQAAAPVVVEKQRRRRSLR